MRPGPACVIKGAWQHHGKKRNHFGDHAYRTPCKEEAVILGHENPWFLITLNEIVGIQDSLQDLRHEMPVRDQTVVNRIVNVLNTVRDRRP